MTAAHLPDAPPDNWVDRLAPPALRPWLKLGRFDRPAGAWLLMLPGWQAVALAGAAQGRWPHWVFPIAGIVLVIVVAKWLQRRHEPQETHPPAG